jgi:nicotinate-nucleotide adenylyltransferase
MKRARMGILGGAFDPVHIGHLLVAQDVKEKLKLDRVLFVLSAHPPHKDCILPYEQRRLILKTALRDYPGLELCEIEQELPEPSFTVETMARLKREYTGDRLFLLIGADQYAELNTWKEPASLARYARLAVMTRPGTTLADGCVPATIVPVRQIEISSTEIRQRIGHLQSIAGMIPQSCRRLIERKRFYLNTGHGQRDPGPKLPEPAMNAG